DRAPRLGQRRARPVTRDARRAGPLRLPASPARPRRERRRSVCTERRSGAHLESQLCRRLAGQALPRADPWPPAGARPDRSRNPPGARRRARARTNRVRSARQLRALLAGDGPTKDRSPAPNPPPLETPLLPADRRCALRQGRTQPAIPGPLCARSPGPARGRLALRPPVDRTAGHRARPPERQLRRMPVATSAARCGERGHSSRVRRIAANANEGKTRAARVAVRAPASHLRLCSRASLRTLCRGAFRVSIVAALPDFHQVGVIFSKVCVIAPRQRRAYRSTVGMRTAKIVFLAGLCL